jgi:4-aminobutyrate aminotransferase / (S)-3-amino-2-methylpropionate transaminase / 5-aminovalerate transaminase
MTAMNQASPASVADQEQALLALEDRVCSHGDTVHYAERPKIFDRCRGSYLYDLHGQRYLDLQMWYSAVNLGYANAEVTAALQEQMTRLPQLACQYLHREKIELAQMLCESFERAFGMKGRVHFNVGGSQAIEDALKLVRKSTGRQHMLAFQGGYHGRTLAVSAITSSYRYREAFGEFADRAEFLPYPYTFRSPFPGDAQKTEDHCVGEFERLFEHEYTGAWNPKTGHSEFGALFIEAVQGTGGYIVPPKNYFRRMAAICKERGILVVDDEIQMGFYRTGKMWAIEHFDIQPDIVVFGKALTNGMNPISGLWAREELISPKVFGPGSTHSTFSSNTLGTATGLAVMKIFAARDYGKKVAESGAYFLAGLTKLQRQHPEIGEVGGLGLALRMEMCEADGRTPSRRLADRMFQIGLEGGLRVGPDVIGLVLDIGGYYKNVITLAPSLDITREEMDQGLLALDVVLRKAKQ